MSERGYKQFTEHLAYGAEVPIVVGDTLEFRIGSDTALEDWHPLALTGVSGTVTHAPGVFDAVLVFNNVPAHCDNVCHRLSERRLDRQTMGMRKNGVDLKAPLVEHVHEDWSIPFQHHPGGQ